MGYSHKADLLEFIDTDFSRDLSKYFLRPFLTSPSAPITAGTVSVLRSVILTISISKYTSIYTRLYFDSFSITSFDRCISFSGYSHINQYAFLQFLVFNNEVWPSIIIIIIIIIDSVIILIS